MTKILSLIFTAIFAVQVAAMPVDRSTIVPSLVMEVKIAHTILTDYRAANRTAEKAAGRIAAGYADIPKKDREAAKARDLCQWEASLRTMADKLETFHGTMAHIQAQMEEGVAGGLGKTREKIDGLVTEFSNELVQQERSSAVMMKLAEISPDAVSEMDAQKLNHAIDAVEQRKAMIKKFQERSERIAAINETIQQKIEGIKAVVGAVQVRIMELKTEAYLVDVLKKEHQVELLTTEVFGINAGEDAGKIFDSKSSQDMDIILGQKTRTGMSQRELLRLRMGGK